MRMFLAFLLIFACVGVAHADVLDLTTALQKTYTSCVDIDEKLHDMKVLAGINTAVTSVGTAAGVGAVATGFVKASTDKKLEELLKDLIELETSGKADTNNDGIDFNALLEAAKDLPNHPAKVSEIQKLNDKSKKLGNWRTGLLAGNTATNIAGAIIAGKNQVDDDLQNQINRCKDSLTYLKDAIMQARMNGEDITEAQNIYEACKEYNYVDISKIKDRAKGAMVSTIIGATTGATGTLTSAVANTDKIRNDYTEAGKNKEKGLNTASNILAIGSTAASATATVFNATQIAAIKKVAAVSEACTGVLK